MDVHEGRTPDVRAVPAVVVVVDVTAKVVLVLLMLRVALDPAWGNLEGKAPLTRAWTYPLLALLVPAAHLLRPSRGRYPWGADLLITIPAFSDVLGNRLDLYDRVSWFDDLMHFANTGFLSAAVVILCGAAGSALRHRLALAVASGMTMALAWELWEYVAFVTRSTEVSTAYADTIGDLTLGWAGAVLAALLVGAPSHDVRVRHGDGPSHEEQDLDLALIDPIGHATRALRP
ncbi:hypothetical protein SAMN05192575_11140 [Nocardioides alpinus]|uniref:Uncharacterized protein n=1 Tax=Nocardioides alpinus TaxID=748909 RepID=A0A1I1AVC8_9ACTN|nr:hypothetical protein [Nocardioides alpinus]PKH40918.1 hypothetical protein CXG46_10660 [Nocardioides alpinus]SFB42039.1 hypothetical protein SAMN05192575_11140 [Nocardioides alpinus]